MIPATKLTPTPNEDSWAKRNAWMLAAVWLVFLIFPLAAVLGSERLGTAAKASSVALMVVFAGVYVHAFWRLARHEQQAMSHVVREGHTGLDARLHAGMLVAVTVALFAVGGVPTLGVVPFVVAFGVFHFSWPVAATYFVVGIGATLVIPLAYGVLGDVWFLSLIALAVGGASILVRVVETGQAQQAELQTNLAVSGERNRVARDVHDVLGHSLTAVVLKAELCQRLLDELDVDDERSRATIDACRAQLDELQSVGRSSLAEIRSTVGGLRAANLADEVTVARTVLADAGVTLLVTGEPNDVPARHRPVLAWVVREAVTNVVRHAQATQCRIDLAPQPGPAVLRVSDDGVGLGDRPEGNGLRGLRERVEAAGGTVTLQPGPGTTMEVTW